GTGEELVPVGRDDQRQVGTGLPGEGDEAHGGIISEGRARKIETRNQKRESHLSQVSGFRGLVSGFSFPVDDPDHFVQLDIRVSLRTVSWVVTEIDMPA